MREVGVISNQRKVVPITDSARASWMALDARMLPRRKTVRDIEWLTAIANMIMR